MAELRDLASRSRRIPNITLSKMMSKPILLGICRKKPSNGGNWEYEHALRAPAEIVIADDMNSYQLFGDAIFVAPQELEGARRFCISSRVCLKSHHRLLRALGVSSTEHRSPREVQSIEGDAGFKDVY